MGNDSSKLKPEEVDNLRKATHWTKDELQVLFQKFKKENPSGVISKATFMKTLREVFKVNDDFHHDLIFRAYDTDDSGSIDFKEFISVLSILQRGSPSEKLEMSFNIYDLDGDGEITKPELVKIVSSIFKVRLIAGEGVEGVSDNKGWKNADAFVDHLFSELDINKDGKITKEEYKQGALRDPNICKSLNLM
jgi:Ca2+-binding EF-hand superfamily protein